MKDIQKVKINKSKNCFFVVVIVVVIVVVRKCWLQSNIETSGKLIFN